MFGKSKKRLAALEARIAALETTETWEFGRIPTSRLWYYLTKLIREKPVKSPEGTK